MLPLFRGVSGHLATISSSSENSFVQSILDGVNAWVDGSKSGGYWVFSSGPEAGGVITYFNWNAGSPTNNLCLGMLSSGYLADVACSNLEYYVVEYECPYGGAFTLTGCSIGLLFSCLRYFSHLLMWFVFVSAQYPENGHFYEVVLTSYGWANASTAAAARTLRGATGHLASITGTGENAFITTLIGPPSLVAWIGVSQVGGVWVFSSGPEANANVSYGNWQSVLSNSGACGVMRSTGQWDDISCASSNYFIVEYECAPGYAFNSTACYGLCMFCCCPS